MDYTSGKNQGIVRDFVNQEVSANVGSMVEYILEKSYEDSNAPFSYDDIENLNTLPEWRKTVLGEELYFKGGTEEAKDEFMEEFDRLINDSEALFSADEISEETHEHNLELIEEAKQEFEEAMESEQQEILEWWLVSSYLCRKLKDKGEPVIESEQLWGRTTSGQAIYLDWVICDICNDLNMLVEETAE